ncbi:hypothetical protein L9F63_023475, partial [Diploptera punctata]
LCTAYDFSNEGEHYQYNLHYRGHILPHTHNYLDFKKGTRLRECASTIKQSIYSACHCLNNTMALGCNSGSKQNCKKYKLYEFIKH